MYGSLVFGGKLEELNAGKTCIGTPEGLSRSRKDEKVITSGSRTPEKKNSNPIIRRDPEFGKHYCRLHTSLMSTALVGFSPFPFLHLKFTTFLGTLVYYTLHTIIPLEIWCFEAGEYLL
jgi:hypothetical protein